MDEAVWISVRVEEDVFNLENVTVVLRIIFCANTQKFTDWLS